MNYFQKLAYAFLIILFFLVVPLALGVIPGNPGEYSIGGDKPSNPEGSSPVPENNGNTSSNGNSGSTHTTTSSGGLVIESVFVSETSPKPGEDIRVRVELRNDADEEIRGELNVWFEDNGDDLEDDDGDDIEDSERFRIEALDDGSFKFDFDMPYDVKDGDSYDVMVLVEGTGRDTGAGYTDSDSGESIRFDKESHELLARNVEIFPARISCGGNTEFDYELINLGNNDEDVIVNIVNKELGVDYTKRVSIDEGDRFKDSLRVSPIEKEGRYDLEFSAEYSGNRISDNIEISISDCKEEDVLAAKTEQKETSVKVTNNDVDVVSFNGQNDVVSNSVNNNLAMNKITAMAVKDTGFFDSEDSLFLMIILFIVLLGLVIYAFGAVIIILSKK